MKSTKFWIVVAAFFTVASLPGSVFAADYPTKAVRFVCWSSAGSPLDTMMRQLAKQMSAMLGQSVAVENRPGGSGAVAMSFVMSQPADGYTVLSTTSSMPFTMATGRVPFKPDDFIVLPALESEPSSVAVLAGSQFKSLKQFVDYLHAHPNGLKVGGYSSAGFHHFVLYELQQKGDFQAAWIPFNGGNKAALALLGGNLDVAVMTPSSAVAQLQSGKIRLLAVSSAARDEYFPDVPTFKEQGYDMVAAIWRGIMVKKDTPRAVTDKLLSTMKKIEATAEWKKFMKVNLQVPYTIDSVDAMQTEVRDEVKSRREFLKKNGYIK